MDTIRLNGREYPRHPPTGRLLPPDAARWKRVRQSLECALAMLAPGDRALHMMLVKCQAFADSRVEGIRPMDLDTPDLPFV